MTTVGETQKLNRLEKRAIEALAVAPVIRAVAQRMGKAGGPGNLNAGQSTGSLSARSGAERNAWDRPGSRNWCKRWPDGGRAAYGRWRCSNKRPHTYSFNVTRCPYYEKYRELGLDEYGTALSCCRDEPFARGFHHRLSLARTQTIMEGAAYCDFRYSLRPL